MADAPSIRPQVFKAYDVRGIYGEELDARRRRGVGRAFVRVLAGLADKPAAELRIGLGRDMRPSAPELAARYRDGMVAEGADCPRRRDGRHRDALLPRRLPRPRRRADVHRLPQPQGVHRGQAGGARRDRAVRRPGPPGHPPHDRGGPGRPTGRRLGRGGRHRRGVPAPRRCGFIDPAAVTPRGSWSTAATGWPRRWSGRCSSGWARSRKALLEARRQLPRPRAQPPARGEPPRHRREVPRPRAPSSGSPGTATPTAASSSTTAAASSTATSSPPCWPTRSCASSPGETILYDVRAVARRARHRERARRHRR